MPQEKYICSASSEIRILYPEKYTKLPPSQTTGPFHFTQRRPFYILFSSFFTFWLNPKVFTRVWEGFVLFFPEQRLNPPTKVISTLESKTSLFHLFNTSLNLFLAGNISRVRHLLGNYRRVLQHSSSWWRPQLHYKKRNFAKIVFAKSWMRGSFQKLKCTRRRGRFMFHLLALLEQSNIVFHRVLNGHFFKRKFTK